MRKGWKFLKVLLVVAIATTVVGFVVMHLWNWLMPAIFGLRTLSFWQAVGLFVLSKLLLSGFHGGRRGGGRRWGRHMRERWQQMTPEQQERFRKGMRGGWRDCWHSEERTGRGWGKETQPQEEVSHG